MSDLTPSDGSSRVSSPAAAPAADGGELDQLESRGRGETEEKARRGSSRRALRGRIVASIVMRPLRVFARVQVERVDAINEGIVVGDLEDKVAKVCCASDRLRFTSRVLHVDKGQDGALYDCEHVAGLCHVSM